jgi:hypothetical protein
MNDPTATTIPLAPPARNTITVENAALAPDLVREKLADALTPGYQAEFDPGEADAAGAFVEDALSEVDALASAHDATHFAAVAAPMKS